MLSRHVARSSFFWLSGDAHRLSGLTHHLSGSTSSPLPSSSRQALHTSAATPPGPTNDRSTTGPGSGPAGDDSAPSSSPTVPSSSFDASRPFPSSGPASTAGAAPASMGPSHPVSFKRVPMPWRKQVLSGTVPAPPAAHPAAAAAIARAPAPPAPAAAALAAASQQPARAPPTPPIDATPAFFEPPAAAAAASTSQPEAVAHPVMLEGKAGSTNSSDSTPLPSVSAPSASPASVASAGETAALLSPAFSSSAPDRSPAGPSAAPPASASGPTKAASALALGPAATASGSAASTAARRSIVARGSPPASSSGAAAAAAPAAPFPPPQQQPQEPQPPAEPVPPPLAGYVTGLQRVQSLQRSGDSSRAARAPLEGIIHITSTFNNTIMSLTDKEGQTKMTRSAGNAGFRNARKALPVAAERTAEELARKSLQLGYGTVSVRLTGMGSNKQYAVQALHSAGLTISQLIDVTPVPYNGCRPPKKRRI